MTFITMKLGHMKTARDDTRGLLSALLCYLVWGLVPIFWKQLKHISSFELITHRIIWSAILLIIVLIYQSRMKLFWSGFKKPQSLALLLVSTILISMNWLIFIWAVNENRILETSLGYYINPLISIFMGRVLLKESLSRLQKWAVTIAAIGVLYLVVTAGHFPWISITLAFSFASYGLIRKLNPVDPIMGLAQESALLFIPGAIYLGYLETAHVGSFGHDIFDSTMLFLCGLITIIPLLLFLFSLKKIKLSTMGMMQFLTPTTTFFLAIFYYNEPFDMTNMISFIFIWIAIFMYVSDLKLKSK